MAVTLHTSPTLIDGCLALEFGEFEDNRGFFSEAYREEDFQKAGLPTHWAQDNISVSKIGVIRGLHLQKKNPQGKLIRCLEGKITDVCLDVRPYSPSFGKWVAVELSRNKGLYLPPGTAHGFLSHTDNSVVYYKCTTLYDKESDGGINPFDAVLGIPWWSDRSIVSGKDLGLPSFNEYIARL